MAGIHIGTEQQQVIVGFQFPQFGHPFRRLPVLHLGIVQSGGDQHMRISLRPDAVVGAVAFHVVVIGFILWIPPLFKFPGGQWNRFVQHGGHHIDERHLGYHAMKQLRTFVNGHAHQHPAGAAPHAIAELRIAVPLGQQRVTDVQIVVEGIFLTQKFAVLIPLLPQLAPAADMGDGVDKAAVEQAQPAGAEIGIDTLAIRAVAIDQQRIAPLRKWSRW